MLKVVKNDHHRSPLHLLSPSTPAKQFYSALVGDITKSMVPILGVGSTSSFQGGRSHGAPVPTRGSKQGAT